MDEIGSHLRFHQLAARFPRPPQFDTGPALAGRIRGAIGYALKREDRPPWRGWPSAYDLMFGQPLMSPRAIEGIYHNPSRPFVIAAREDRGVITVEITLFGIAAILARQVKAAVDAALRRGIQIEAGAAANAKIADIVWDEWEWWGASPLEVHPAHAVHFVSPFCPSHELAATITSAMLVGALTSRLAAVAAWNGLMLDIPSGAVAGLIAGTDCDASNVKPTVWARKRGKGPPFGWVTMHGFSGYAVLHGDVAGLRPVLALALYMQIGMATTFGLGVVEVG